MALQAHLTRSGLAVLAVLASGGAARADMLVSVENNNSRGFVDHFEVVDDACHRRFDLTLGGRTSDTIEVCGGLGNPGSLRIRYAGDPLWTSYADVRSWSVLALPSRPAKPKQDKDGGDDGS